MLEQCCNYSKQCRAKNRRCESSRVISPCKGSSSFTKWTFGLEQNHLYYESKVKEYFLCNTNVPVSVRSFFVFVKKISDKSRLTTFKASLKLPLLEVRGWKDLNLVGCLAVCSEM